MFYVSSLALVAQPFPRAPCLRAVRAIARLERHVGCQIDPLILFHDAARLNVKVVYGN
jgi:hypothetical protein